MFPMHCNLPQLAGDPILEVTEVRPSLESAKKSRGARSEYSGEMVTTHSSERLILRAVLRQMSPVVIRSPSPQMPLHEFHDMFRTILDGTPI
jgi:hypothetical protein